MGDVARLETYIHDHDQTIASRGSPYRHRPSPLGGGSYPEVATDDPVTAKLRRVAALWSEMDDNIKQAKRAIVGFTERKKEYEIKMLDLMQKHEVDGLTANNSYIRCITKTRKKRVTKDAMRKEIIDMITDPELRNRMMSKLLNEQPTMTDPRLALRRSPTDG